MTLVHIAIGISLGALGAGSHLAITRLRAEWIRRQHLRRQWLALPVGIAVPVVACFLAMRLAPAAGLSALAGLVVTHRMALGRLKEAR